MSIEVPEADSFVCRLGGEKNHVEAKLRRDFADFADTDAQHGSCDAGRERERCTKRVHVYRRCTHSLVHGATAVSGRVAAPALGVGAAAV